LQIALAAAAKISVKEGAGGTGTEAQTRGGWAAKAEVSLSLGNFTYWLSKLRFLQYP